MQFFESYLAVYIWGRCYLISLIIIARSLNSYDFSKKKLINFCVNLLMLYAAANRYFYGNRVKQLDVEALMEIERQKMHELLDQYRHVLLQAGVLFYLIFLIATLVTYIKRVFTGIEFIVKFMLVLRSNIKHYFSAVGYKL